MRDQQSKRRKSLEKDFETLYNRIKTSNLSERELNDLTWMLSRARLLESGKRHFRNILLPLMILVAFWHYSDTFQWTVSAIGRLLLLQLLPYWDWTKLDGQNCLIGYRHPYDELEEEASYRNEDKHKTIDDCILCQEIDEHIDRKSNVSFGDIESLYLERGLPLIIVDSVKRLELKQFFDLMMTNIDLERVQESLSNCLDDLNSNLMLKDLFHLSVALEKAWKLTESNQTWFLQLHFCQFEAVKESRILFQKPYYYPFHWEPFYSSWLMISHRVFQEREGSATKFQFSTKGLKNDEGFADKEMDSNLLRPLNLKGFIIIQQFSGSLEIHLIPRDLCKDLCSPLHFQLMEGESLAITTDLWQIHYDFIKNPRENKEQDGRGKCQEMKDRKDLKDISIASIMEFEWNPSD